MPKAWYADENYYPPNVVTAAITYDAVAHPQHYKSHPSGVEVIEITKHENFCIGNVIKYVLRAEHKGKHLEDLRKARQYLDFEITRVESLNA